MKYQYIDMETYKRKEHFAYFSSLAYPYVGLTVNVEITRLLQKVRQEQIPFFLTFCYCVSQAANSVVPFRQRILDQKIIEFDLSLIHIWQEHQYEDRYVCKVHS